MPEPRYRGESWQASILRAELEAAAARRAEAERAEPPQSTPNAPPPETPRPRPTWRDLAPDELNRYALAPIESRHS